MEEKDAELWARACKDLEMAEYGRKKNSDDPPEIVRFGEGRQLRPSERKNLHDTKDMTIGELIALMESYTLRDTEWVVIIKCRDLSMPMLQLLYERYWEQYDMILISARMNSTKHKLNNLLKKALGIIKPQIKIMDKQRKQKKTLQVGRNSYHPEVIHTVRKTYKTK